MGRTVRVVDNGGIPFLVRLSSSGRAARLPRQGNAKISALVPASGSASASGPASYAELGTVAYTRARIGLCPTERESSRAWWHGGNSVLLHTSDRADGTHGPLVYIGTSIKSFVPRPNDTIVAFVSPMGNSAVPYPYAIGRTHTYLLEEDVCIDNATLVRVMASAPRPLDPYEVLYGYDLTRSEQDSEATAPRKFGSERQRMRGAKRNKAALALPTRVLVPRNK